MTANAKFDTAKYGRLLVRVQPVAIQSDKELARVAKEVDSLVTNRARTPEEERLLDLLTDLIEKYESEHHQIDTTGISGADTLKFLIEENELVPAQLAKEIGISRGVLGDILKGRRSISKEVAKSLAKRFNLSVEAFI